LTVILLRVVIAVAFIAGTTYWRLGGRSDLTQSKLIVISPIPFSRPSDSYEICSSRHQALLITLQESGKYTVPPAYTRRNCAMQSLSQYRAVVPRCNF